MVGKNEVSVIKFLLENGHARHYTNSGDSLIIHSRSIEMTKTLLNTAIGIAKRPNIWKNHYNYAFNVILEGLMRYGGTAIDHIERIGLSQEFLSDGALDLILFKCNIPRMERIEIMQNLRPKMKPGIYGYYHCDTTIIF